MLSIVLRLLTLGLFCGIAASIGSLFGGQGGAVAASIATAALIYGLQAYSGMKLLRWLDNFQPENIPRLFGWWDDLAARLFHYLRLHQRQQQALNNALISFRTAAQALPDGVVSLDATGHILWCNETAENHLALKSPTDMGQPLVNLVRNPDFSAYLGLSNRENPLVMRSPRTAAQILSIRIVNYGDHQQLVLTRDITQMEKLERMRRDFIANVSHELKTPLTVLSGFLETFRDMPLNENQRTEYLQLMHDQACRMQNLVKDLLTLSSLESAPRSNKEINDLSGLAQRAMDEGHQLSAGKHQISAQIQPNLMVQGNATELYSALSNIVTNAIKYTPEHGTICVTLEEKQTADQNWAVFTVIDNGIGIAPEHLPRLTERFYRVDRSRSRESGGTGLGLAIVKHVVSRHDGELDIKSRPNLGSTFQISLPLCRTKPPKMI